VTVLWFLNIAIVDVNEDGVMNLFNFVVLCAFISFYDCILLPFGVLNDDDNCLHSSDDK